MQIKHRAITAFFEADHDRLDLLFQSYLQLKKDNHAEASSYFAEFLRGLRRHIVWEEDVLFPFFEQASGIQEGPTRVMRHEHQMISAILNRMHEKVCSADPSTDAEAVELLAVLGSHNQKEENVLYPTIDRLASPERAAHMFLKMEQIPQERFTTGRGSR